MIHLTRLNHVPLVLNSDLIESIDVTPDTVISLTTGQKLVVREPAEEVVERVLQFRRAICSGLLTCVPGPSGQKEPERLAGNRKDHGSDNRDDS
jgi:flagellar protein FlbD